MLERQFLGMEKLAFQAHLFSKAPVETKIAVLLVHHDRVTELGEMEANLVETTGFYFHPHQSRIRKAFQNPVVRQRRHQVPFSAG